MVSNLQSLKERIGDSDVKLMFDGVEFTQNDKGNFPQIAADPVARSRFVQNLYNFCVEYGLDGFDMDWEYSTGSAQWVNAGKLLKELHDKFSRTDKLITLALPRGTTYANAIAPYAEYIDWVNIMLYDLSAENSSVERYEDFINEYKDAGIESSKLVGGMPFYGRGISNYSASIKYRDLYAKGRAAHNPENDEAHDFYYNGYNTIAAKAKRAVDLNCAGVMIWEVSYDLPYSEEHSLLRAINSVIKENE